jgi:hypothetical protein
MVPVPTYEKLCFRFRSSSYFWKVTVPVPAPYLDQKKLILQKKILENFFAFLPVHNKLFYKEKVCKFQQIYCKISFLYIFLIFFVYFFVIYCKMWMKNMLNEGNQIHTFISSSGCGTEINYGSGSDILTSYGSGSTSQKVTVPTVPVPQHSSYISFYKVTKTESL